LNEEYETELLQYIIDMQQRFYGLSLTDVRQLAFQFAERNNIDVPFSKVTQLAGKDWTSGFLRRHQKETSAASSTSRPTTTASDHAEIPKRKASNRISQAETSIATKEQSLSVQRPMRTSRNPAITKPRPPSATRIIIRKPAYLQNAKNCVQNIPHQPVKEQQLEPVEGQQLEPVEEQQLEPVEEQQLEPVEEQQLEPVEEQQLEPAEEQQLEPVEEQQLEPVEEQQLEPVKEQQLEPVEEQQLESVKEQQLELVEELQHIAYS